MILLPAPPFRIGSKLKSTEKTLLQIYRRLFKYYGPQHWWPGDSPFEVMVGAILTQSTAWQNVEKAVMNLKTAGAVSPAALREIHTPELAQLIRPSGYYNAKARKLQALVHWLSAVCGDNLNELFTRNTGELRLSCWGSTVSAPKPPTPSCCTPATSRSLSSMLIPAVFSAASV